MRVPLDYVRRALVTALCLTSLSCAIGAVAAANDPHDAAPTADVVALPRSAPVAKPVVVVALGDSVPAGSACDCRNFVSTYADLVARHTGRPAVVTNLARSGAATKDLLEQVQRPEMRRTLSNATTVLLMIGANDFYRPFGSVRRGASAAAAYRPVARRVQRNLAQAIGRIRALHDGPVTIAVLDYWNVVQDGRVARRDYGPAGVAAAESATAWANQALKAAARAGGALLVSTYAAFKGADGHKDPTALLAADGDHPNAAGQLLLAYVVYAPLPTG
ncbi:MAG TPA: SGNH/GDSL hydrolase family protein [Sporichthyaceae bacterium]|jgi:lysophospholipase L1-like esterase